MNITKNYRLILVNEIKMAVRHMSTTESPQQKMFFFSAVFGIANRIMNLEFDPELGFLHNVLNSAYNTISANLALMSQPQSVITLPQLVFDKLQEALNDLANSIEHGETTYTALERISNIAYSTSGNGFYLYLNGKLKI